MKIFYYINEKEAKKISWLLKFMYVVKYFFLLDKVKKKNYKICLKNKSFVI
jgi:hypothetical protein